jgi:DNA-binding response OmpR family regulator
MIDQEDVRVLIVEKDTAVVGLVKDILRNGSYDLHVLSSFNEAVSLLKSESFQIAVVGTTLETDSPFEGLVDMVKASPLTSIILLSDLPEAEVHEQAEGCGILGHVPRSVPSEDLNHLLYRFKQITGLL